jgi:hypothetical protein
VKIAASARRHGIEDEDMLHAINHAMWVYDTDDFIVYVGGARDARHLLEVGVATIDGEEVVVHAMPARTKFLGR